MQPIDKLVKQIFNDFSRYRFKEGGSFRWSPQQNTIFYSLITTHEDIWSLLHEIAHAELNHLDYGLDVELIGHEAQAWEYATSNLAPRYALQIDDEYLQGHLDTYRLWLHARSKCPDCGQNGLQTQNTYRCLNCRCLWRANEARLCSVRRIKLQGQSQSA